jgi:hypothetical protein
MFINRKKLPLRPLKRHPNISILTSLHAPQTDANRKNTVIWYDSLPPTFRKLAGRVS